jgi:pyruvate dehydrogenase E1 component
MIGSVHGYRLRPLPIEHFGQTGSIAELYRPYGIDALGIVAGAEGLTPSKPIRRFRTV